MTLHMWNVPVPGAWGPPDKIVLFDDFIPYSGNATLDECLWFETLVGGTPGAVSGLDNVAGGAIVIQSPATSGETGIEPNGAGFSGPGPGKKLYFETRVRINNATVADGEFFVGLATPGDVAPIGGATNRVGFMRQGGSSFISTVLDATETATTKQLTNNGWVRLAFQMSDSKLIFFIDLEDGSGPSKVDVVESGLPTDATTLMPKLFAGFALGVGTMVLTIDYILVMQDR